MSDLIKRSDAIEAIEETDWYHQNIRNKDMVNGANSDEHQAWYKAEDIYNALEAVPSADRPQGEWELSAFQNEADVANGNYAFICSNCEHTDIHALTQTVPYCWWCGARMKGADDEASD